MTGGRQDGTGDEDRKTVRTWENKENEQRGRREGSTELGGMKCRREGGRKNDGDENRRAEARSCRSTWLRWTARRDQRRW